MVCSAGSGEKFTVFDSSVHRTLSSNNSCIQVQCTSDSRLQLLQQHPARPRNLRTKVGRLTAVFARREALATLFRTATTSSSPPALSTLEAFLLYLVLGTTHAGPSCCVQPCAAQKSEEQCTHLWIHARPLLLAHPCAPSERHGLEAPSARLRGECTFQVSRADRHTGVRADLVWYARGAER